MASSELMHHRLTVSAQDPGQVLAAFEALSALDRQDPEKARIQEQKYVVSLYNASLFKWQAPRHRESDCRCAAGAAMPSLPTVVLAGDWRASAVVRRV